MHGRIPCQATAAGALARQQDSPRKICTLELSVIQVEASEVRFAEIGLSLITILLSPVVPRLDSFLKLREMFGIRQGNLPEWDGLIVDNDTFVPK